jgi:hypothetical protein
MCILRNLFSPLYNLFPASRHGKERATLFVYTLITVIVHFTSARTSNLLRALQTLFEFDVDRRRFYTFMDSPKLPWERLWECVWRMIPNPLTEGRLLIALDDFINPKTGKKIFACSHVFDHAAKLNQAKYPWAQNVVSIGLLKLIKNRWTCLPLAFLFYHMKKDIQAGTVKIDGRCPAFKTKLEQAVEMLCRVANAFSATDLLVVTDTWFGNDGLFKPMRQAIGERFHLLSRLRVNITLYALPAETKAKKGPGRRKKYGHKLGNTASLAALFKHQARPYLVDLYGKLRQVMAYDQVFMLKTLKCPVRVVWVYRKNQWVALFTTDLTLSVEQIIAWYGARWKIESGFKELKQDIGSADSQNRNPHAVTNHLHFCMMAATLTWIYADQLKNKPKRRHAVVGRRHFAFSDVRRSFTELVMSENLDRVFPIPRKAQQNSFVSALLRMVA